MTTGTIPRITDQQFLQAVNQLEEFIALPTISDPSDSNYKLQNLEQVAKLASSKLMSLGFKVYCPAMQKSAPFVIAERIVDATKPTFLFYAHYDVHSVNQKKWQGIPFALQQREGRFYGYGVNDDKGAIIMMLAALEVCNGGVELPNIKIVLDGEKEHDPNELLNIMDHGSEKVFDAQALVVLGGLDDGSNLSTIDGSTWIWTEDLSGKFSALYNHAIEEINCNHYDPPKKGYIPLPRKFHQKFPKMEVIITRIDDRERDALKNNESLDVGLFRNSIDAMILFLCRAAKTLVMINFILELEVSVF